MNQLPDTSPPRCWCGGMGDTGPGSYGVADSCDVPCPGNDSVACGGKRQVHFGEQLFHLHAVYYLDYYLWLGGVQTLTKYKHPEACSIYYVCFSRGVQLGSTSRANLYRPFMLLLSSLHREQPSLPVILPVWWQRQHPVSAVKPSPATKLPQ